MTTKEKQIQTTADHTLSKQIEQKDRRISELEDALSKSRKKEEKLHKAEKELADARLKCQRQTKEISNLESYKKTAENHRAENEHLWEKYESLEQSYDVEKSRSADFEKMCHDLQNQLHQVRRKTIPSSNLFLSSRLIGINKRHGETWISAMSMK